MSEEANRETCRDQRPGDQSSLMTTDAPPRDRLPRDRSTKRTERDRAPKERLAYGPKLDDVDGEIARESGRPPRTRPIPRGHRLRNLMRREDRG